MLAAPLLALAAVQIAARVLGRSTLSARLLPTMRGGAPYLVWALRLWPAFGLPALAALLLLGRGGAVGSMPPEFGPAAAWVRAFAVVEPGPVLLGLSLGAGLGALIAWWRSRRGGRVAHLGRPPRLPRAGRELPAAALLALSAGVAEELYFRLALPLLIALVSGSATLGFGLAAAAFGAVHRYQGPVGVAATGAVALLLSVVYLGSGSLWLAVLCHAAIDLNALVIRPAIVLAMGRGRA
ncbi:CPBP family intramembrane glutamic endopeptidase [uncultured Sphingomonas sp.]|uniref:CPBP family intramembrane glutamic endopeptidase n=1 Tax=uncultured Sphingomonas sp. TaxID=158754 RepID=UPI0035CC29F1